MQKNSHFIISMWFSRKTSQSLIIMFFRVCIHQFPTLCDNNILPKLCLFLEFCSFVNIINGFIQKNNFNSPVLLIFDWYLLDRLRCCDVAVICEFLTQHSSWSFLFYLQGGCLTFRISHDKILIWHQFSQML